MALSETKSALMEQQKDTEVLALTYQELTQELQGQLVEAQDVQQSAYEL